jgi:amidase
MTELALLSATELAARLRAGDISSLELTDHYIERVERSDEALNAVVVKDFDRARDAARQADAAGDKSRPLHGLPMTIKESYDIAGLPTTWGVPAFADNIATEDAEMVRRYKAAGALFLGKTNVPLNLADFQSYNDIYGTSNNPWNTERIPGGSSGGSAIAMAAGLSGLESGSDIGGSIRNPAHFCGVYGHKPTWGVVPPQGHALPGAVASPDIATCGPLARSAEDLALAMDIISGAEPLDAPGWQLQLPRPQKQSLKEYRVAVWATSEAVPVSDEVAARATGIGETLQKLGATVSFDARPQIDMARAHFTYINLLQSIMGAAAGGEAYEEFQRLAAGLDPADMSEQAITLRAMVLDHRNWLRSNNQREKLRYQWREFFNDWDILICPQMATPAFPHDHTPMPDRTLEINGETRPYFEQVFWAGFAVAAYLPSTVFPTGPSAEGLPIGLQAVSAEYNDYTCIDFARLLAREIGGFRAPPDYGAV